MRPCFPADRTASHGRRKGRVFIEVQFISVPPRWGSCLAVSPPMDIDGWGGVRDGREGRGCRETGRGAAGAAWDLGEGKWAHV